MKIKLSLATVGLALITACGGGDGGDGASLKVTNNGRMNVFALKSSYLNLLNKASQLSYSAGGKFTDLPLEATGTISESGLSNQTFEGVLRKAKTSTRNENRTSPGPLFAWAITWTEYYDESGNFKGSVYDYQYVVSVSNTAIPISVKAGDKGQLYVANHYSSSSKTQLMSTTTATYQVDRETDDSVLVKYTYVTQSQYPITVTSIATYRLTSSGTMSLIQISDSNNVSNDIRVETYR